jgi:sterol desaturase/sphingolipid hydroxylase (fatty acid hydroxylase superfamily)
MIDHFEKWIIYISTPLFTVLILGEVLLSHWHERKQYTLADTATNVLLMVSNMGVDVLMRGISLFALIFAYDHRVATLDFTSWWYWTLLFFLEDFIFYWLHRMDHTIRLLWAIHVTHHSSEKFNLSTGFRSSVFQPVYRFVWFLPLTFCGFRAFDIFIMYSITQIYGILVHTREIDKMGFLEKILVTPSHHRVHHASNVQYLDKNMGMILIVWDKLFHTFEAEKSDIEIRFGIFEKTVTGHPLKVIFHEWAAIWQDVRNTQGIRNKVKYMLKPPGWSHDGSRKTSKQLREELEAD